jgi:hypothetical protein
MASLTTLTALPSAIYAGDTLLFSVALADYPASDGWTLSYYFRQKQGSELNMTATADGDSHLFNIDSATTSTWLAGDYYGVARVTDGTNVLTVGETRLTVYIQLSEQGEDYDTRTHAQKCLDSIEAVMEGRASKDIINTTIAGQSVARMTPEQLAFWRNYYRSEVSNEQAAIDAANGKSNGRNILMRFL